MAKTFRKVKSGRPRLDNVSYETRMKSMMEMDQEGIPWEDIAETMGYSSKHSAMEALRCFRKRHLGEAGEYQGRDADGRGHRLFREEIVGTGFEKATRPAIGEEKTYWERVAEACDLHLEDLTRERARRIEGYLRHY